MKHLGVMGTPGELIPAIPGKSTEGFVQIGILRLACTEKESQAMGQKCKNAHRIHKK